MTNSKMNLSVVLAFLALLGALDRATSEQFCNDEIEWFHPLDSVVKYLSKPITDWPRDMQGEPTLSWYGCDVYGALAKTQGKDEKVFLNQYSANDLLPLNEWNYDDCTNEGLEKRRKGCERFTTKERTEDHKRVESEEGYTRLALGYYCWAVIDDIEERCPVVRVREKLIVDGLATDLAVFRNRLNLAESKPMAKRFNCKLTSSIIFNKVLAKEGTTDVAALRRACSIVVDGLEGRPCVRLYSEWPDYLALCKKVLSSTKHSGAKD